MNTKKILEKLENKIPLCFNKIKVHEMSRKDNKRVKVDIFHVYNSGISELSYFYKPISRLIKYD